MTLRKTRTHSARNRRLSLSGASIIAFVLAQHLPSSEGFAQAFQGEPTIVSGGAAIIEDPGTTDIVLNTTETVIDWVPFDADPLGPPIDFLPIGKTAKFSDGQPIAGANYIVLNRIFPFDDTGSPTGRIVAMNGIVESQIGSNQGGVVWFYSPNGLILGPNSRFNVGSLGLTTNDIDTTGGLLGSNGEIRFRGPPDSLAAVEITPNAKLNAMGGTGSYVALVAPRILQRGNIQVNGSTALVAAEQVDIIFNAGLPGLVNILITQGTTDANGVVHSGATGGPASLSGSGKPDNQRIYMVGVPKNDAMTMLLSGSIGYIPAVSAFSDGSSIILAAGRGLGFDDSPSAVPEGFGNIEIGNTVFSSRLSGSAGGTIDVIPDVMGTTQFRRPADLYGRDAVNLIAMPGSQILADGFFPYSLNVTSGFSQVPGKINLFAQGDGTQPRGVIEATGNVNLDVGSDQSAQGGIIVNPVGGASINAGSALIDADGGSISAFQLFVDASGRGQNGQFNGGNGNGGEIEFLVRNGGVIDLPGIYADASGSGGEAGSNGGKGFGGGVRIIDNGGLLRFGEVFVDVSGKGGDGDTNGGNATGGGANVDILVNSQEWKSLEIHATATGGLSRLSGTMGPAQTGLNPVSLLIHENAALTIANDFTVEAIDTNKLPGNGFSLSVTNTPLAIGGNTNIATTGDVTFSMGSGASFATAGTLMVMTDGMLSSQGALSAGNDTSIIADLGITSTELVSGGTTLLQADNGPVQGLSALSLQSAGLVTVLGMSVEISSPGPLSFADAEATDGDMTVTAAGDLALASADATGALALTSTGGSVRNTGNIASSQVLIEANTSFTADGPVSGSDTVVMTANDAIVVNDTVTGLSILANASDIDISPTGMLGQRGATERIVITNIDPARQTVIGDSAGQTGQFYLDGDEVTRLFADAALSVIVEASTTPQKMTIGDVTLTYGPDSNDNLGARGELKLASTGDIEVVGNAILRTSDSADKLVLTGNRLDIMTDSGSLAMRDGNGDGQGNLEVIADTFTVASSETLSLIEVASTTKEITQLLDEPAAFAGQGTNLEAGNILVDVTSGFYVQNSGASEEFIDRRGFSANSLTITTANKSTFISINGLTVDGQGGVIDGLNTAQNIVINGQAATASGQFDPASTINGCVIGTICDVTLPPGSELLWPEIQEKVNNTDPAIDLVPAIKIREAVSTSLLPLLDEPVVGVGNEDLWEDECGSNADKCSVVGSE